MSVWYHYLITEAAPITEEDMGAALEQISRRWYIDGDLIVQKPTEDAQPNYEDDSPDIICGQVTFTDFENGVTEEDEPQFYEGAEESKRRAELLSVFRNTQRLVSVQIINRAMQGDANEEPLAPLWKWLLDNRQGVLIAEGGTFYDKAGRIS